MSTRFRGVVLTLLFLAMLINYMDRAALSIAMPFISKTFSLSPSEKGIVFSSFFVGYALFNVIGGYLSDRIGPKRVFTWAMLCWSGCCALTAAASGFVSLLVFRTAFGMGEGPISATANRTVANWFPTGERARAVGLNQAGGPLGGALAGPVVGFMAIQFGWRLAFVVVGCLGVLWVLAWARLATDHPRQNARVSSDEAALIAQDSAMGVTGRAQAAIEASSGTARTIFRNPAVYVMAFSLFCCSYNQFFFLTWFPTYLVEQKHLSLAEMSVVSSFPWLAGALGYVLGGLAIDALYRLTGKVLLSRKVVLVVCLALGGACVALTGQIESARGAVSVMSIGVGFVMLTSTAYWALIQAIAPRDAVGGASGLMHGLGNISGIVAPTLTGFVIQSTRSYSMAFTIAGALALLGAVAVAFLIREPATGAGPCVHIPIDWNSRAESEDSPVSSSAASD
ncbi:MFS transporter [Paraburkholderia aspalathi]|uniref:Sugar phosphate permease n=1 Tax=Paraburkholderia aspalathi TaxID=1324617 RepID=A0A1I7DAE9_9BURK|nr:MFS transporter [Paraburkholderia aspalathi]SFU08600.1 Sugar phosphate permease [Paraburkholderia aspalathi]